MAIAFARPEYVGRSNNKNACCKSSYNSRSKIVYERAGKVFNFTNHGGNAYHEMLLPEYVDKKFKNAEGFSNEVERAEKRKDSQLYVEWLLALPKEKEITLEMKKEIIKEFIERKGWIKEGLGVQIDIHEPHDGEKNWHAHLLVTTRRFKKDGSGLEDKKAVDLQPEIKYGKVQKTAEIDNHKFYENVLNDKFKAWGLDLRADLPGEITQEHVGPVRMRSIFNEAVQRNEERKEAEIELLNSGARVLEKVTKHMSVFTKGDLTRAVKCIPDSEVKERLVEDALSSSSIIPLVTNSSNGNGKIKYYTTRLVRDEEQKILRLSSYVANLDNVIFGGEKIIQVANTLINDAKDSLTDEQHKALSGILLGKSGLRVLRGRAGTGKSYVLGKANSIASNSGINVIGLAPTHKAKLELGNKGYENIDTVKGMLFKLANSRFDLPKHSLIVVDEAGMVGNDDYKELLRVAATRKCNVILAGDERQLASIQRGGMFEVFAKSYGSSSILDIKRQDSEWGKAVAMAFSKGEVATGLSILDTDNRIKWDEDASSSMHELLHDWSVSEFGVRDRLILAVRNKDVAALNHGAREHFKLEGKLTGEEFSVDGNHYMKGDRVLITKTNKKLGLTNGDLAEISHASQDKFTLRFRYDKFNVDNDKYVSFDPGEYRGFRHGYATTVFKAQGASIPDVYVYHDGFSTLRNSYVSLSRHVEQLRLYVNKSSTGDMSILTRQLANDFENGSSLRYMSVDEQREALEDKEIRENFGRLDRMLIGTYDFLQKNITKFKDKYIPSSDYYNYKEPKQKYEAVNKVIDRTYDDIEHQNQAIIEEKLVVGGNTIASTQVTPLNIRGDNNLQDNNTLEVQNHQQGNNDVSIAKSTSSLGSAYNNSNTNINTSTNPHAGNNSNQAVDTSKPRLSAKSRFYANVDRIRAQKQHEAQKEEWGREYNQLKSELRFKAEAITRDLLGDPNKRLSNGRELRYGDHGKLAVCISGEKAGTWHDFGRGEGGDLFHLVQETRKTSFKEAADYLRSSVGMSNSSSFKPNLQLVHDHANSDSTKEYIQEKEAKIRYANKLYDKSKPVSERSIASNYLKDHRSITCKLSSDIKTTGIYDQSKKEYLPALIAYARNKEGDITGGQHLLLDKETKGKADIEVPKRSFDVISGSFVDLGNTYPKSNANNNTKNNDQPAHKLQQSQITIIAEGLETGLSVKQSLSEHSKKGKNTTNTKMKILCSLGISNIKNYEPIQGQKIIIASDNDGKDSITNKAIHDAASILKEKGAFVEIVTPENHGDFNDVLVDKENGGSKTVANSFRGAIDRHSSKTLLQYFASNDRSFKLSKDEKTKIEFISQFKTNEEKILNAYRNDSAKGREELNKIVKPIKIAHDNVIENKNIINEINMFGGNIDKLKLTLELSREYDDPHLARRSLAMDKHIWSIREKYHLLDQLKEFKEEKQSAKTPKEAMIALIKEQEFLAGMHSEINPKDHSKRIINSIQQAHEDQQSGAVDKLYDAARYAHKEKIISPNDLTNHFKSNNPVADIHNNINRICYKHHCKILTEHYNKINRGEVINHQGYKFDCVAGYLEHWKDNVHHDMLPVKQMNKQIERVHEQQRDRGDDHHISLDM
ncbi:AAA family ATPase [Rickettsiaceae bacterium]|nr:AAA family ATPase [Rickettsiaceae bacterium]